MTNTWSLTEAVEWLTDNFNDVPVTFFTQGGYAAQDRENAEFDFMKAVTQILSKSDGDKNLINWAENITRTRFKCLVSDEVEKYWGTTAIIERVTDTVTREVYKTAQKPAIHNLGKRVEPSCPQYTRQKKRQHTEQADDIYVGGIRPSLSSYIKTLGNSVSGPTAVQVYVRTIGENNIFDISDSLHGTQLGTLTQEQRDAVKQRLEIRIEANVTTNEKLKSVAKLIERDQVKKASSTLYQLAITAKGTVDMQARIYRVLIDRFKYDSTVFHKASLDKLSEADFIVKFWGPIIESLFLGSEVRPHWGDTVPLSFKQQDGRKPKMDLRLLCIGTETEQDSATGEFGRHVKHSKYHKDKRKLAISAKSQLNAMIKGYRLSTQQATQIYVSTIQVLGTRAELRILRLVGKGLYSYQKVETLSLPVDTTTFATEIERFIRGLSVLKQLAGQVVKNTVYFDKQRARANSTINIFSHDELTTNSIKGTSWTTEVKYGDISGDEDDEESE